MIENIAVRLTSLWGWRRLAMAALMGALSALAMPPFFAFPVLFLTLPGLIWLLDGASEGEGGRIGPALGAAFAIGWAFGMGYFLAGTYWIGAPFLVEFDSFGWAMPLALVLFPAGLALFPALACAGARLYWKPGWPRIVVLALAWTLAALLRGHIFTGLPWNLIGYGFTGSPQLLQSVSVIGIYGLTLLAVLLSGAPAALGDVDPAASGARPWLFPALMVAVFALLFAGGALRLSGAPAAYVDGVSLRIVHPNIDQIEKWKPENRNRILELMLDLSDRAVSPEHSGVADANVLIWPEVALPFLLLEDDNARSAIAALLPPQTRLFTGAIIREKVAAGQPAKFYNGLLVIDDTGALTGRYDKVHLVPFGEFLPFQEALESIGLRQLTRLRGGFTPGPGPKVMAMEGLPPFSPLVCYEAIFPGAVTPPGARPAWLLNVTNDAWFGNSTGPRQHFQQARVRAVEEGLPLVRAANAGISAVIDPYGRIIRAMGMNRRGVVDSALPAALPTTVFARFGLIPLFIFIGGLSGLLFISRRG